MPPLMNPAYVRPLMIVGPQCLPPNLLEAISAKPVDKPHASGKPARSKTLGEHLDEVRQAAAEIGLAGSHMFKLLGYSRYSRKVRRELAPIIGPGVLERHVHDARGQLAFPSQNNLVIAEGGKTADVSQAAKDAYEYSGIVYRAFRELLGFELPQPLVQTVDFNTNSYLRGFNNAAFMPLHEMGAFNFGLPLMIYGRGDGAHFHHFSRALDVVGHELGHFYLNANYPGKFPYAGQAGAINEHLADVIGKCVEAWSKGWLGPYEDAQWRMGAELMVAKDAAIRNLKHPGTAFNIPGFAKDTQPDRMRDLKITDADNGGVHTNSGIMNRLFALFVSNVGEAMYSRPLKVWLRAMDTVEAEPNFYQFALQIRFAAREFGLEKEFLDAAKEVGVFDYLVYRDKVVATRQEGV